MRFAGQYLGELGRHQEAAENYVKASQITPEDFELIFNTANALRQANRNEDAEAHYKKAARLRPNVSRTGHEHNSTLIHVHRGSGSTIFKRKHSLH